MFVVARTKVPAPKQEITLISQAVNLLLPSASDGGEFHAPSVAEFFPEAFLFEGTPFEINRIMMIRLIVMVLVVVLFWLGTRRMRVIPGRFQSAIEMIIDLPRKSVAQDLLGEKDGKRFAPLIVTIFITVLFMNLTGIIPFANIAGTSVIGLPLVLAVAAYIAFIWAGIRKHGGGFFKTALFPSGVPWPLYIIVTPIEIVSTFILRPVTLTLRLLMNMMVGHLLLVLFFAATQFFMFSAGGLFPLLGVGTFAFGFAFTLFELLVAVLQAYVFALLTTVYIQLSLADEH